MVFHWAKNNHCNTIRRKTIIAIQYGEKHEISKTWSFILIQIKLCECITTKYIPVVVVIVCNNLDLQKCYLT